MTLDIFTLKAQDAIKQGQGKASANGQQEVVLAHIIKGIIEVDEHVSEFLFKKCGVDMNHLVSEMDGIIQKVPKVSGEGTKQFLSKDANKAMAAAKKLLKDWGDEYISIDLVILGILKGSSATTKALKALGVDAKKMEAAIKELRKGRRITDRGADNQFNALKKYAVNLTEKAAEGKLDPIIGRDEEIRRILHILSRRKKNNPLVIGEAGVGKTAIVEGIAWRIVNQDVPESLKSKQIYSLDMAGLIAGAKYKGEFEERLKSVIKEVTDSQGQIIMFVDEIHTLIGAGGGGGAMDAANILKPALARGELRTIGATTLDEYQKYFEKDKALVRRFQTVMIDEPSVEETISILRGLQEKYEVYHKIELLDEALVAAAELSHRYIADRFLPDKAIDLIDESAAKLRLELDSVPDEIDELSRKIRQLEIEREFIKREKSQVKKMKSLNEQISTLQEKLDNLTAKWQNEKDIVDVIQGAKEKIENFEIAADKAERESNFEKVAELRYGKIKEQEAILAKAEKELHSIAEQNRFTNDEVTANDIAEVVARWTGIPVAKMLQSEKEKLLKLEEQIGQRLIGQEAAVEAVSDAVRRSRAGLQDGNRPIGSFIFLGPTGVGKTELAKALAEVLFNDENAITRIDMSEFQERHSVSRLVGAPPGYVGYDEGGQLTEAVRRRPYSIVLLDEIEKAHPDTFNILLQVLDDGRLTDSKGRVADFKNTIIIMTSNMGADIILDNFEDLEEMADKKEEIIKATEDEVFELLKEDLRPEFLNRIDEKIMFRPLTRDEIKKILGLLFKKVVKMMAKQDMGIELSPKAQDYLGDLGYDPQFGARPMKRVLQKVVINELSKHVLSGKFGPGDHVIVDVDKDGLIFKEQAKGKAKPSAKTIAKPAVKTTTKPVAKTTTKPVAKPAAKPVAKKKPAAKKDTDKK